MHAIAQDILNFWFGDRESSTYGQPQPYWFKKSAEFDAHLKDRYQDVYQLACSNHFESWRQELLGSLALILIFDQFPRNFFRGTPQAFATDNRALVIAQDLVQRRQDQHLLSVQRWFVYLPFEHSEALQHQRKAILLFEQLRHDPVSLSAIDYAYRHHDVIQRFGRFPHRNKILNRDSTSEEIEFLNQPGSRF